MGIRILNLGSSEAGAKPYVTVGNFGADYTNLQDALNTGKDIALISDLTLTTPALLKFSNQAIFNFGRSSKILWDAALFDTPIINGSDPYTPLSNLVLDNVVVENTNATHMGVGFKLEGLAHSKFNNCDARNVIGGFLVDGKKLDTYYNEITNPLVDADGVGSYGIKFKDVANDMRVIGTRIKPANITAGSGTTEGVVIEASHSISLINVNVEAHAKTGIHIKDDSFDINIFSPYLELNDQGIKVGKNTRSINVFGGFIAASYDAGNGKQNIVDEGCLSLSLFNVDVQYKTVSKVYEAENKLLGNLQINGDQENDANWSTPASGDINEQSTEEVYQGSHSRKLYSQNNTYANQMYMSPAFSVTSGKVYEVFMRVKTTSGTLFFSSNAARLSTSGSFPTDPEWQELRVEVTASSTGVEYFRFRSSSASESCTAYIDDIKIREVTENDMKKPFNANDDGSLTFHEIPTSATGLDPDTLYSDGGTLKLS